MDISSQKLPQARVKCTVKIAPEERTKAETKALEALGQRMHLKGFRPGKAPVDMVRANADPDELLTETVRSFLPNALKQSLEQAKANPILPPQVGVESREPLVITITFVEKPEVKLTKPEKIKIEKKEPGKVEQKDIDEFLKRALASFSTETPVERPAQKGDVVYVSSQAVDASGGPIKELSHPHVRLHVGAADDFAPGIGDQLQGMKTGDSKTVDAAFPKDHVVPALREKKAKVTVTAKSVAESRMPELTAEFLKNKLNITKSPEEFRTDLEKMLGEQRRNEERRQREEAFFDAVRSATKVDLSPELIEAEVQEMLNDLQERLKREGMTMDDWIRAMGKEPKEILDAMRDSATKQLTLRLGLEAMMDWKKIVPDDARFKSILEDSKKAANGAKADEFEPGGQTYRQIEWDLKMRKLMEEYVG